MMQPGAAGAVPDHIMRMQLQTLQMQAMSLGVGAGLPGALPGASAPMMVRYITAPGARPAALHCQTTACLDDVHLLLHEAWLSPIVALAACGEGVAVP